MDDHNDPEVRRMSALLKTAIQLSGASNRDVERRLGLSAGYLSRLFSGGIEFKVKHVLDVSEVIELDPAEFFHLALPGGWELTSPTGRRLLDLVSRIRGAAPRTQSPDPPTIDPQQLQDLMRGAVRELFAELGRAGR
jgi:hypothetical protein